MSKTKAGCTIKRGFMFSPNGQDMNYFLKLLDRGYKEIYYTAPYHWSVVNPKNGDFVTYTEGDIDHIDCPNKKTMISEIKSQVDWFKKSHSSAKHYCAEGVELLKELRKKR